MTSSVLGAPVAVKADALWAQFAGAVGAGRVRIARDRWRRQYETRWERTLDPTDRPVLPAAVRTFDAAGDTRCLVFDLDAKRLDLRPRMLRDCERLTSWLTEAGCAFFVDESPHAGRGRHVYVPLDHPLPFDQAAALFHRLRAGRILPSLDIGPMVNLRAGCIRPPGAAHRFGGHQLLLTPLADATRAVATPTTGSALAIFRTLLPAVLHAVDRAATPAPDNDAQRVMDGSCRPLGACYAAMAATGQPPDPDRYASPSEVRYAVLVHALRRGWTPPTITQAILGGRWPGLAQLYRVKYGPRYAPTALAHDLDNAVASISAGSFQKPHTSAPQTRRGGLDLQLRRYRAAIELAVKEGRWSTRSSYGAELVLLALAAAGRLSGIMFPEHGVRHLAYAAGTVLEPAQVGRILKRLRAEHDPFILLVDSERGAGADVYELRIPDAYEPRIPTDPTQLPAASRGVHPAFARLPHPAHRLFQALEAAGPAGASVTELSQASSVPTASAYATAQALITAGLARRRAGGIIARTKRSLDRYGRLNGIATRLTHIINTYRIERAAWRAMLGLPDKTYPPQRDLHAWPGQQPTTRAAPPPVLADQHQHEQPRPAQHDELHAADPLNTDWTTDEGLENACVQLLADLLGATRVIGRIAG